MNKKIIAAAIAASFVAPAVIADTANINFYGHVRQAVSAVDLNNGATDEWRVDDMNSRLGLKGSEDLGNGLKAIYQIEMNLRASTSTNAGQVNGNYDVTANRNTFVGLSGDFGTVLVGRHDAPHNLAWSKNNPFSDTIADLKGGDSIGGGFSPIEWERIDGTIAYISPSFSGLTAAMAIVPLELTGVEDSLVDTWSGALMYKNGGLYASVGHWEMPGDNSDTNVTVMYTMDALTMGVTYEVDEQGPGVDEDTWIVTGKYVMGNNVLKAHFFDSDIDNNGGDSDGWALGVQHNFSKRTSAEVIYTDVDSTQGEADGDAFSVQLNHAF